MTWTLVDNIMANIPPPPVAVFEQIPNIGPNWIPKYYLHGQIDQIELWIIQASGPENF